MSNAVAPAKASPSKYDAQILAKLYGAERRIRLLDLTSAALILAAGSLAYFAAVLLLDHYLQLPVWGIRTALGLYLAGAVAYAVFGIVRPLHWRINPYYAARRVEDTVDGAKNSLINWLDLHDEKLPPAILASLGKQAARDINQADIERVESTRRAAGSGAVTGALLVAVLVLMFFFNPFNLMRAFSFGDVAQGPKTQITLVKPDGGDTTVVIGKAVTVEVQVDGKVPAADKPDSLRLQTRYAEGEAYKERPLEDDGNGHWSVVVPAVQVKNGFWYKVVGGDGETPEHRVDVRAAPMIDVDRLLVTYHYPDYMFRRTDRVQRAERKVEDFRGTRVTLEVPTNRKLAKAWVEFKPIQGPARSYPGTIDPRDPQRFTASWELEQDGQYRLLFISEEQAEQTRRDSKRDLPLTSMKPDFEELYGHPVRANRDAAPVIEIKKPGADSEVPVNGLLKLEALATDDVGIKTLKFKMRVLNGADVADRPYRNADGLKLQDGGYPTAVDYKEAVDIAALQGAAAEKLNLKEGMKLEYWLEATDNCDQPGPNVGVSKTYIVTLIEPDPEVERQRQDREQANKELQQHQQDQDKKLQEENQSRQKEEERRKQEADKNRKDAEQKQGDQKNDKTPPKSDKENTGKDNRTPDEKKKDEELEKRAQKLEEEANKEKQKNKEDQNKQGQDKGQAKADKKEQPGQGKDDPSKKEEKNQGSGNKPDEGKQGQGKGSQDKKEPQSGEAKKPDDNKPQEGQTGGKPEGQPMMEGAKPGADKPDPKDAGMPMQSQPAAGKQGDPKQQPQGKGSQEKQEPQTGAAKKPDDNKPQEGQTGGKPEGQQMMEGAKPGADKPDPNKGGMPMQGQPAEGKQGDPKQQPQGAEKPDHGQGKTGGDPMMGQSKPEEKAGQEKGGAGDPKMMMTGEKQGEGKQGEPMPMMGGGKDQPAQAKGQPAKKPEEKGTGKDQGKGQTAQAEPKKGNLEDMSGTKSPGQDKGAEPKGMGQPEQKPGQGKAEKPPTPEKGDPGKQEVKNNPGKEMTKEDVRKAIEELKNADAGKREEARKKLEQAADNAEDKEARAAAEKELQKQGRGEKEREPGAPQPPPPSDKKPENKNAQPCEKCKDGPGMGENKQGEGKQGPQGPQEMGKEGEGKGKGPGKSDQGPEDPTNPMGPKDPMNPMKPMDPKEPTMGGMPKGPPEGVSKNKYGQTTDWKEAGRGAGEEGQGPTGTPENPTADKADARHRQHAGDLQLKGLSDEQKKKVLKDAGFKNEAEYQEFLKAYQQMVDREAEAKKTPTGPSKALPTTGGKEVKKGDGGTSTSGGTLGQPPPEYRDPYQDFTRRIGEKKQK